MIWSFICWGPNRIHTLGIGEHLLIQSLPYGFLPPANEVCEGYVFTPVCQSFCSRGHAWWGCAWQGNMHSRGHTWWVHVWQGGMHGSGGHAWQGGMHGGGHAWQGTCMPCMPP